jgi:ABC-2 type transport system ATP-binding protein
MEAAAVISCRLLTGNGRLVQNSCNLEQDGYNGTHQTIYRRRMMIMTAIKTVGLTKQYKDVVAVDHLDLEIRAGELFSLLGVNGAGKSTTIKMLSTLIKPTGGEAFVGGHSITREAWAIKPLIGVSPQETAVAPNLTVRENLELMCGIHGLTGIQSQAKIRELADQFDLHRILSKRSGKLSGGWQRRVSIAMALIGQPSILFLDEPTLGLDVIARSELWDVIRAMKGKVTIILTTHYMEEAQALSDRIGIMKNGKLLVVGTAGELMAQTGTDRFENAFISIVKEADV